MPARDPATAVPAPSPAFLFSDAHLGSDREAEPERRARLLRFLDHVRSSGRSLVCLGDLFDFWFEYDSAIPARHFEVLRRLQDLSRAGVRLFFIGGNHDFWVRRGGRPGFLEREIGFTLLRDGTVLETAGLRLLLVHGDGIGPRDLGYRALKLVLRNRAAIESFRWVHPDLAERIGALTSRLSRRRDGGAPSPRTRLALRAFAREALRARPDLDAVVAGHLHLPDEETFDRGRYLNLGDWIVHASYAVARDGVLTLERFEPSGEPRA
jgi:UDP-2,3-diacylglucosamine hydrolase